MEYTCDYFIEFFGVIPENRWCSNGALHHPVYDQHCAYGHCDERGGVSEKGTALWNIFRKHFGTGGFVAEINDGSYHKYQQPTAKQRILAALYDIKNMQDGDVGKTEIPKPKEVIRYVSVPESIKGQSTELVLN